MGLVLQNLIYRLSICIFQFLPGEGTGVGVGLGTGTGTGAGTGTGTGDGLGGEPDKNCILFFNKKRS